MSLTDLRYPIYSKEFLTIFEWNKINDLKGVLYNYNGNDDEKVSRKRNKFF